MPGLRENKWSRYLTLAFSLLVVGAVVYFLGSILVYVVIAWILSLIGRPVTQFLLKKLRLNRLKSGTSLASIIVLVLFFIFFWLVVAVFSPMFIEQVKVLSNLNTNSITEALSVPLSQLDNWLLNMNIFQPGQSVVHEIEGDIKRLLAPAHIGQFFGSIVSLATSVIFGVFAVTFILFFFLKEVGLWRSKY